MVLILFDFLFILAGINIKEKWETSNNVTTEVTKDDVLIAGSKLTAELLFNPKSSEYAQLVSFLSQ